MINLFLIFIIMKRECCISDNIGGIKEIVILVCYVKYML